MEFEIWKTDGEKQKVETDAEFVTIEELYKAINTDIVEVCYLSNNKMFILDEEGKLKGKVINEQATKRFYDETKRFDDCIVGDVVLIDRKYIQ